MPLYSSLRSVELQIHDSRFRFCAVSRQNFKIGWKFVVASHVQCEHTQSQSEPQQQVNLQIPNKLTVYEPSDL